MKIAFILLVALNVCAWSPIVWAEKPTGRIDYALVYSPNMRGLVMHGGWGEVGGWLPMAEVWKLDDWGWARGASNGSPALVHHCMTYDSDRGVVVMCGETNMMSGNPSFQTWQFDGSAWTQFAGPPWSSGKSGDAEIAYDAARHKTLFYWAPMVGALPPETWEYDGTNWVKRSPATLPVACADGALLKNDPVHQQVVLVGSTNVVTETWLWNGTNWTKAVGIQPSNAVSGGMAFDVARGRMVLLTTDLNTWTFDGSAWTQHFPPHSPTYSGADCFSMEYLPERQVCVFFGGEVSLTNGPLLYPSTTWQWNGQDWSIYNPRLFTRIAANGSGVSLNWNTDSGNTYQVLYNANLMTTNWTSLTNDLFATSNSLTAQDLIVSNRFYQIKWHE